VLRPARIARGQQRGYALGVAGCNAKRSFTFTRAVVRENAAASLDGSVRCVTLCVDEPDESLGSRWFHSFSSPGMGIALAQPEYAHHAVHLPIASSPYEVRTLSVELSASIVHVFCDSSDRFTLPGSTQLELRSLAPGDEIIASEPIGQGFSPVIASFTLSNAMNDHHPLLFLAFNTDGIAAARSALMCPSLEAYADIAPTSLLYQSPSSASAACVEHFDEWRSAGISVDLVTSVDDEQLPAGSSDEEVDRVSLLSHLVALESNKRFRDYIRSDPSDLVVAASGLQSDLSARVSRTLRGMLVPSEHILFPSF